MSHDQNDPEGRGGADDDRDHPLSFGEGGLPAGSADGDLADLQRLRRLYQSVHPPEPSDAVWMTVRSRIGDAVPALHSQRRGSLRSLWAIVGLAAAAAILGGVLLVRSGWLIGPIPQPQLSDEEPYPVAESDDVNIISMDARDVAALVIGEPPISGDLEFVQQADVRVIKCERCPHSGNVPRLARGEVPMFVTSVARAVDPNDE